MTRYPLAACVLAACTHGHVPPTATPDPGIAIALYADAGGSGLAIVDDRRWVDVASEQLVLDDVAPDVALSSLVIESLTGPGRLAIGTCARDRIVPAPDEPEQAGQGSDLPSGLGSNAVPPPPVIHPKGIALSSRLKGVRRIEEIDGTLVERVPAPSEDTLGPLQLAPTVHCAVTGPAGRYLLRVLYTSTALAYHAEHEVKVTAPDRAEIASHVAVTTPRWHARDGAAASARVVAYDGMPGGEAVPTELVRGTLALDGSVGVLALPPRNLPARIRRVLTPSEDVTAGGDRDEDWLQQHRSSPNADETDALVWVWLELPGTHLAPGLLHVRLAYAGEDEHEVVVTAENRADRGDRDRTLRLPLFADDDLRASINRTFLGPADPGVLVERFAVTVDNIGTVAREVYVEEKVRPGGKRSVSGGFPGKPGLAGDVLRVRITVPPTQIQRAGFVVTYEY